MASSKKLSLSAKIFISMILGALVGFVLNFAGNPEWSQVWLIDGAFRVVGQIFISLLKMLVVPLVFVSLVCGSSSLSDPKMLGRVGGKTVALYLLTTAIAVCLALGSAVIFKPGIINQQLTSVETQIGDATPFTQVLIDMVPTNPIAAMADGQMLPIIFFAVLLGISITLSKEIGVRVANWFHDMNAIIMKLVTLVMRFAPYGVFALIAILAATSSADSFAALGKYVGLVFAVLFVHALLVYPAILSLFGRLSPHQIPSKIESPGVICFHNCIQQCHHSSDAGNS